MRMSTSSMSRTEGASMSMVEEMRKEDKSSHGTDTTVPTRDGKSSILTRSRM